MPPPSEAEADKALLELFQGCKSRAYRKGDVILRSDDEEIPHLYLIDSGFVKAYSLNNRGEEYIRLIYAKGEVFPITNLLSPDPRIIFYEAMDDTMVSRCPRDTVLTQIQQDPTVTYGLLRKALKQFRVYSNRIDNLEFKYARERVAFRLLLLNERFGVQQSDGTHKIDAPISQQALASSINVSREGVSRELERLKQRGILEFDHRRFIIKNIDALKQELGMPFEMPSNNNT